MKRHTLLAMTLAAGAFAQPASLPPAQNTTGVINPQFNAARPRAVYPVPYGAPTVEDVTKVIVRVRDYLAANTPARMVHRDTGAEITALPDPNAIVERGAFNVVGYEWGVVYSGMLLAAETTGDNAFRDYVDKRMKFLAKTAPLYRNVTPPAPGAAPGGAGPGRGGAGGLFRAVN
ncbi:MAG: hypothetical protein ABIR80_01295, partial [Opitutaceae bacterium]